jgi:hypothetical protein
MHRAVFAVLLLATFAHGQSLADQARAARKDKTTNVDTSKVFTSDDISSPAGETIRLSPGTPGSGQGTLIAPGLGKHSYRVIYLDATHFPTGGVMHVHLILGPGASEASFDLFAEGASLPTDGIPHPLASAHNVASGGSAKIDYRFDRGATFQLAAEGSWNHKAGETNDYNVVVDVTPNPLIR